jgi:hypothetical protein
VVAFAIGAARAPRGRRRRYRDRGEDKPRGERIERSLTIDIEIDRRAQRLALIGRPSLGLIKAAFIFSFVIGNARVCWDWFGGT